MARMCFLYESRSHWKWDPQGSLVIVSPYPQYVQSSIYISNRKDMSRKSDFTYTVTGTTRKGRRTMKLSEDV